jgi:hypothetical protein
LRGGGDNDSNLQPHKPNVFTTNLATRQYVIDLTIEDAHQDTIAHHPTMYDTTIVEALIRHNVFSNNIQWRPQHNLPYTAVPIHSFGSYLCNDDLTIIKKFTQGISTTTILRSRAQRDVHLTTADMRDLLTHDTPIYHELLILSLEILCQQFDSTYLDPAFFPNMRTQGWQAVARRFGTHHSLRWPKFDSHNIAIPVHVNGNHWVAICHRKIGRTTYFFYANDLNNPRTEQ